MKKKGWYIVAYDIANPKRLQQVHRIIKKRGLSAQRSVFFVRGTESSTSALLDRISKAMVLGEDDLRAYPIASPKAVWTNGPNPLADFPLITPNTMRKNKAKGKKRFTKLRRILGI